jgi:hypothetical protein
MTRIILALFMMFGGAAAFANVPCYNFAGDPGACNAYPGCYWDTYGDICAEQPYPGPFPGPYPTAPLLLTGPCESNGPLVACPAGGRIVAVQLDSVLPGGPCIYGQTWTYDASYVYVSNMCRAYFTVSYYPY